MDDSPEEVTSPAPTAKLRIPFSWEPEQPRSVVMGIAFIVGFATGDVSGGITGRRVDGLVRGYESNAVPKHEKSFSVL